MPFIHTFSKWLVLRVTPGACAIAMWLLLLPACSPAPSSRPWVPPEKKKSALSKIEPTLEKHELLMSPAERGVSTVPGFGSGRRIYGPCIRVLSIDGGGIRGIIPAMILANLERQTGKPITEYFNAIVGTSTGAIIALGLTKPNPQSPEQPLYSAAKMVEFYEHEGPRIFPPRLRTLRRIWGLFTSRYSPGALESALDQYFGDSLLQDAVGRVIVSAYEIEERRHIFLDSSEYDTELSFMRDVARAATAAPMFFPPARVPIPDHSDHNIKVKGYFALVDGAVFANNPAPYAYRVASQLTEEKMPGTVSDVLLVSLGTGGGHGPMLFDEAWHWGGIRWIDGLLNIVLSDPGIEEPLRIALKNNYVRFQPNLVGVSNEIDDARPKNIRALKRAGEQFIRDENKRLTELVVRLNKPREPGCGGLTAHMKRDLPERGRTPNNPPT